MVVALRLLGDDRPDRFVVGGALQQVLAVAQRVAELHQNLGRLLPAGLVHGMPTLADFGGQQPGVSRLQGRKQAHVLGVVGGHQEVQRPIELDQAAVVGVHRIAPGQPVELIVAEAHIAARGCVR